MIRPITCLCVLAACGSGLYLYHAKHKVHLLDQQIEQTVRKTEKLREQTRMLHAEWTLLNDPDRLRKLATQFLPTLQPVSPSQYTDLANLDSRLPPVIVPPPLPPGPPPAASVPVAQAGPTTPAVAAATTAQSAPPRQQAEAQQAAPHPSAPAVAVATPAQSAPSQQQQVAAEQAAPRLPTPPAARPNQHPSPPVAPRPVVAQARPPAATRVVTHPRPDARVAERDQRIRPVRLDPYRDTFRSEHRPAPQHAEIAEASSRFVRPVPRPRPYTGSLLGMAQTRPTVPPPVPLPRPMPVGNYYHSFGGGGG